jgi:phosphate transport system substrate-binding protein
LALSRRRQVLAGLIDRGLVALTLVLIAACGVPAPAAPTLDPLAGQYTASGGGGAIAAVQALTDKFKELHPGVIWRVGETGSDAAIKLVVAGDIDVGFVSRNLKDSDKANVSALSIGFSGTAVVVNAANPVANLTRDQLRRIYAGEITNWLQLGGNNDIVRPFIREGNAATRTSFESYVFGADKPTYGKAVTEIVEVEATMSVIASFRGAIGIATIGSRTAKDTRLRMIAIEGISPTYENLAGGTYKMFRPLFLVYPADASKMKPAVRAFLDFAKSTEGQRVAAAAS